MKLMEENKIEMSCKDIIQDLVYRETLDVLVKERDKFDSDIYRYLGRAKKESKGRKVYA